MSFNLESFLESGIIISFSQQKLLAGWGKVCRKKSKETTDKQPSFYYSDFFLERAYPWMQCEHWKEFSHEEFKNQIANAPILSSCDWTVHHPEQFRRAFQDLSADLKDERLNKAVPYLFAHSSTLMTKQRLQSCLKKAFSFLENKSGYLYGHWNDEKGVIGLTPELLFSHSSKEPNKVDTMALAGTSHFTHPKESLIHNQKQQAEHQIVVQGICESLQDWGSVKVKPLELLCLPRLTHLMTPIEIELSRPFCFDSLVKTLHPTPALGAYPFKEGKKWLEAYEAHTPREYYGSPIGFYNPVEGISLCLIAIRNVQWNKEGMRIGAGCGVVKESHFDHEWEELQLKIRAIRDQFSL